MAALTLVLAAASGCGGGSGGSKSTTSPFETLLGLMPDTPDTRKGVQLIDFARLRGLLGVDLPADPSTDAANADYEKRWQDATVDASIARPVGSAKPITALDSTLLFLTGIGPYGRAVIKPSVIGYGPAQVDGLATAGTPPKAYYALAGRFQPSRSKDAIKACTACPAADERSYQGVGYYSWGGDNQQDTAHRLSPPAFDYLGRGGRMVFADRYILRANWTAGIEELIASSTGGPSLAKAPGFSDVAKELGSMGSYAAFITTQSQSRAFGAELLKDASPEDRKRAAPAWDPPADEPVLRPYTMLGIGQGLDDKGAYLALVLVHSSDAAARDNVDLLKRRIAGASSMFAERKWSSIFSDVSVKASGKMLTARLYGYSGWIRFYSENDPLLLSE